MRIGILLAGHVADALVAEHGDFDRMFRTLLAGRGLEFSTWPVVDGVFPDGPEDADGWLVTGSRHGAYEDHDWIPPLEDLVRAARDRAVPTVGICFGHQLVAQALGGKVEKFEGGWTVGPRAYRFRDGRTMRLNAWHQDQVAEPPPGAEILAEADGCRYAALACGERVLTMQPHPEITAAALKGMIDRRGRGTVPDGLLDEAARRADDPLDAGDAASMIAGFFESARRG